MEQGNICSILKKNTLKLWKLQNCKPFSFLSPLPFVLGLFSNHAKTHLSFHSTWGDSGSAGALRPPHYCQHPYHQEQNGPHGPHLWLYWPGLPCSELQLSITPIPIPQAPHPLPSPQDGLGAAGYGNLKKVWRTWSLELLCATGTISPLIVSLAHSGEVTALESWNSEWLSRSIFICWHFGFQLK